MVVYRSQSDYDESTQFIFAIHSLFGLVWSNPFRLQLQFSIAFLLLVSRLISFTSQLLFSLSFGQFLFIAFRYSPDEFFSLYTLALFFAIFFWSLIKSFAFSLTLAAQHKLSFLSIIFEVCSSIGFVSTAIYSADQHDGIPKSLHEPLYWSCCITSLIATWLFEMIGILLWRRLEIYEEEYFFGYHAE